jgi:hypothetical protein
MGLSAAGEAFWSAKVTVGPVWDRLSEALAARLPVRGPENHKASDH